MNSPKDGSPSDFTGFGLVGRTMPPLKDTGAFAFTPLYFSNCQCYTTTRFFTRRAPVHCRMAPFNEVQIYDIFKLIWNRPMFYYRTKATLNYSIYL